MLSRQVCIMASQDNNATAKKGAEMKKRPLWLMVCLVTALAMLFAGCGTKTAPTATPTGTSTATPTSPTATSTGAAQTSTPTATKTGPQYGGVLRTAQSVMYNSWDPGGAGTGMVGQFSYVYETLGVGDWMKGPAGANLIDFQGFIGPDFRTGQLAESWEWPDTTTLLFYLRKGVHFQNIAPVNGREMTADDVVASWQFYQTNATHNNAYMRTYLKTVTALDKYTVKVEMTKPLVDLMGYLYCSRASTILAKEMLTKDILPKMADFHYVIGTGPFRITDFVPDSFMDFKKNPDYWGYDELNPKNRLPYLDEVQILTIPDASTTLAAFRTGKIDLLSGITLNDTASLLKTNPNLSYLTLPAQRIDCAVTVRFDIPPFNDIRVRKAMVMAIDYQSIIKNFLQGHGTLVSFPMLPSWPDAYTPLDKMPADVQEMFGYHPDKARQLLTEAGYPTGFKAQLMTYRPDLVEKLQLMISYWEKIGVNVEIKMTDLATWQSGTARTGTWEGMSAAGAGAVSPLYNLSFFLSSVAGTRSNFPYYDQKVAEINQTYDDAKRMQMIKDLNVWFWQNYVLILFPLEYASTIWQPWLQNFHGEAGLGTSMLGWTGLGWVGPIAARIWIDQDTLSNSKKH